MHPVIRLFEPVVDSIAGMLGTYCEVVLHDFSDLEHSIIKIVNGHVTGRKVGDPITDFGLRMFKSHPAPDSLCASYITMAKNGRPIKSSSVLIRDTSGKIIGGLCINLDHAVYETAADVLQQICKISSTPQAIEETFETDSRKLLENGIQEVLGRRGRSIVRMSPLEKKAVVKELEARGIFLIKGAVNQVANSLGLARVTVYKYLDQVRKE